MEQDPDSPPNLWFQPPLPTARRRKPAIDPVVLIILIPILVLAFLFFFLPPFLTHTSHILKPGSVKSTWDSLNIFLVIFAILCGVLARKNDEVSGANEGVNEAAMVSGGLRRSSSSYPDLRNESVWENNRENVRNRFYDDFDVYTSSPMTRYYGRPRQNELDPVEYSDVKEIVVDTVVPVAEAVAPPTPPPPPPPPQRESSKRHSFRSVGRNVKSEEFDEMRTVHRPRHKHTKLERKVSDATKEIATAISNISSIKSMSKGKPPLPAKTSYYEREEFLPSGSQSPLIPMPPPPPPPFRMPAMKFELRGDYVRIRSTHSSVCSSPDRDDVASILSDGGDSVGPNLGPGGPISFPSPDVNAKADSFISRLKDEWRMEMNKKSG
ncbi:hypothetical protein CTI12_AA185290 [Artemisia annua]|uniref:Hydroxyproline-rich glycoprotein family protein n=1 Tax=Artemisia annua TaxID=35608 RepID=A0A2U1MRJ6_ARTAN|nr:hypothetical protein CTI12_AA350580 [Artemisia annua]PWA81707.1 hypothetical protein CTI12_AA185290 [Artemisia annua]